VHRHPHVFGDVFADTSEKGLSNWEKIKSEEKERKTVTDKLGAIPPMLPALMRAEKVGKKASCFDFENAEQVFDKINEEIAEIREAASSGDKASIEEELGDLLLTVTSLARKLGVESEVALAKATDKFIDRFDTVERAVSDMGKDMSELSGDTLNDIWDKIKHKN
jgi:MazG family protein